MRSDHNSLKNDNTTGFKIVRSVVSELWWAGKTHCVTGTTLFLPIDTEYIMKPEYKWKKMADKEEWEEMRQEACVSPLGPPPSSDIHSLFFTVKQKKKEKTTRKNCVCLRAYVCDIRGSVFFLHYLFTLSAEHSIFS